ncbi:hypothetical protein NE237_015689 [Protea cynaroides]|uniref:RBR-type E3 ubiquitin transferase n=1 Tax=Protea cynaroides TaxID=273540 RepID=A0A9Q0KE86_9MAGN|nr:hypothetical protein NE237_015689 [Protea cynaroides]
MIRRVSSLAPPCSYGRFGTSPPSPILSPKTRFVYCPSKFKHLNLQSDWRLLQSLNYLCFSLERHGKFWNLFLVRRLCQNKNLWWINMLKRTQHVRRGRKIEEQSENSKEREMGDDDVGPIEVIDTENVLLYTPILLRGGKKKDSKEREMGDGDAAPIEVIDIENVLLYTPISLRGGNKKDPILVEQYVDDKELQQAIHASVHQDRTVIDLSEEDELEEIKPNVVFGFRKTTFFSRSVTEIGQSSLSNLSSTETGESSCSNNPTFVCEICVEPKSQSELFNIKGCTHSYCSECMVRYVVSKIQENITTIRCPESNCEGVLEPEFCRSILPPEVFDRWGSALCESLFLGSPKLYCPYKNCSALLLDDGGVIKESECPSCHRLFCAQCKVPWHSGINCQEFQKLNENERTGEDIMLMELAKHKKWQRCPKCKVMVERSQGCLYMMCRCGFAFCYNCGFQISNAYHYCVNCKH